MKTTIYHNNRCSKSRCVLDYLKEHESNVEVLDLLNDNITKPQLEEVLNLLNMKPSELIRTSDKYFKDNFEQKEYSEEEYLNIMLEHPRLIQRPIVVKNNKAAIGRPLEQVIEIL